MTRRNFEADSVPIVPSTGLAWRREFLDHTKGHTFRYFWNPRFLKRAFDADPSRAVRSPRARDAEPIVLADILGMDAKTITIQARLLAPAKGRKRYSLDMELLASTPVNKRARVTVVWAGRLYTANFVNGHATIRDLPPISSANARNDTPDMKFRMDLDFDDPPRRKKS